jgi:putative glycosyltransferase (TIGR04372 family)
VGKKNVLRRQLWQIRNLGISHVVAKVIRRFWRRSSVVASPAADLFSRILGATTDRVESIREEVQQVDLQKRVAFDKGDFAEYVRLGKLNGELKDQWSRTLGIDPSATRILGSSFFGPLGHIAQLDYYAKSQVLGCAGGNSIKILVEKSRIPNWSLFECWSGHFAFEEISPQQWTDVHAFLEPITETADFARMESGYEQYLFNWDRLNRQWESEKRQHLLSISQEHVDRGVRAMAKMGLPAGAWFVCFHVREGDHRVSNRGANARIETYFDAMTEVVQRGGFAIRIGDTDMTPLPPMHGVIDYAHAIQRADWLDVYLWAKSRFFVGTGSGPIHVPGLFGVPVLMTNAAAVGLVPPYFPGGMLITKHFLDDETGRDLSLDEALARGAGWNWSADFTRHGVRLEDNSSDEIRQAVCDMFDAVDGSSTSYTAGQANFDAMRRGAGSAITTPCAPSFAERYA